MSGPTDAHDAHRLTGPAVHDTTDMKILVLGSAGDCSIAPWRCGCTQCACTPWDGQAATRRTQGSIAVSDDGDRWVLLNVSADVRWQLQCNPQLHRHLRPGTSPIAAVVLTDARLEHVSGLLSLRDGPPLDLMATPAVFEELTSGLPLLNRLDQHCGIRWHLVPVAGDLRMAEFQVSGVEGLRFRALALPDPDRPNGAAPDEGGVGDHIALQVENLRDGRRLFYAPSPATPTGDAQHWMDDADCLLVHGGVVDAGGAEAGVARALSAATARRKVLIHLDDCHPFLDRQSAERRSLDAQGIEVAFDGMEIDL